MGKRKSMSRIGTMLRIRVMPEELAALRQAATKERLTLSAWARSLLLKSAAGAR